MTRRSSRTPRLARRNLTTTGGVPGTTDPPGLNAANLSSASVKKTRRQTNCPYVNKKKLTRQNVTRCGEQGVHRPPLAHPARRLVHVGAHRRQHRGGVGAAAAPPEDLLEVAGNSRVVGEKRYPVQPLVDHLQTNKNKKNNDVILRIAHTEVKINSLTSRFNTGRWNHTRIARRPPAVTHAYAHSVKSPAHKTDSSLYLIAIITRIKITHPTPCPCRRTAKGAAPRCEYPAPIGWLRRRVGIRRAIAPV